MEISQEQRETAQAVLRAGLEEGRNPRNIALDIAGRVDTTKTGRPRVGGFIGLTSTMTDHIIVGRADLISDDPKRIRSYLRFKLRDARYDKVVRDAASKGWAEAVRSFNARTGSTLTVGQMQDRIMDRHKGRALKARATVIARNEVINALRAGQIEGLRQAVETGAIRADQIEKRWSAAGDDRTRPDHVALNGERVRGLDTPFVSGGNRALYPGDTSQGAEPSFIIQCRCSCTYRVRDD